MFNLSKLYNSKKDYNVSVSGAPGTRIFLNVCNKLVRTPNGCTGSGGACIVTGESRKVIMLIINNINMKYQI